MPPRLAIEDLRLNYDSQFAPTAISGGGSSAGAEEFERPILHAPAATPLDPQPTSDIAAAEQHAGQLYSESGAFTTAASAIATWAIIDAAFN